MSHDPSRILYPHIGCGKSPCTCVWDHPPLAIVQVHCWSCLETFTTVTDMANHHLKAHERPLQSPHNALGMPCAGASGITGCLMKKEETDARGC